MRQEALFEYFDRTGEDRNSFEQFVKQELKESRPLFERDKYGDYEDATVHFMWRAWEHGRTKLKKALNRN
jgi:hypothetical protein